MDKTDNINKKNSILKLPLTNSTSKPLSTACSVKNQQIPNPTYSNFVAVGSGTFGTVYKAVCDQTGEVVAVKRVFQDPRYKNRELQILLELHQNNVIEIANYYYTTKKSDDRNNNNNEGNKFLNVVMSYFPENLSQTVKFYLENKTRIPYKDVKIYAYQMIHALYYLNCMGICHRDIKPQNVLVDRQTKVLKICDFGSSKKLNKNESNISYICSRYYRAPELIFNAVKYTNAIDMWSVGCVICEMLLGYPIFQGENSLDQLVEIIKVLGTPSIKQIKAMNPNYEEYKFPIIKCFTLDEVFSKVSDFYNLDNDFYDLIYKILTYEPSKRIKPLDALCHPFFDELKSDNYIKNPDKTYHPIYDILFEFTDIEIKKDTKGLIHSKIIPKWYEKEYKKKLANKNK